MIVVFDEVNILFHFNIILKHTGTSSTKKKYYINLISENKTDLTNNVFWDALFWIKLCI